MVTKVSSQVKDLNGVDTVSRDIGSAGICIVARKPFAVNDVVELNITLPDGKDIKTIGIVKWAIEQGAVKGLGLSDFYVGVKFVKITDSDRAEIGKFIFDTMNLGENPQSL